MRKLENKTVLIAGNLTRTGKACAIAAIKEGANVVVADLPSDATFEAMEEIKKETFQTGTNAIFVECDVKQPTQIERAIKQTTSVFSSIDIALNTTCFNKVDDCNREWDNLNGLNFIDDDDSMNLQIKQMRKQKKGVIVNISPVLNNLRFSNKVHNITAKYGVDGLSKTTTLDCAADGIRINAISPGVITASSERKRNAQLANAAKMRLKKPEELANLFIFLASDDSSFIFGRTLEVDGRYLPNAS